MKPDKIRDEQSAFEEIMGRTRVERCPACDTPVDVAISIELEEITCTECGQNFAENPKNRKIELANGLT